MEFDNQGIILYDVSRWQTDIKNDKYIDFNKLKNYGRANGIILKCGQRNYKDPAFDKGWKDSKLAGLPRGSYWFLDRNETAKSQAQFYWEYIKDDIGEGIHFCDFETDSDNQWNSVYVFLQEFQNLSGLPNHKIGVYTNYYYWTEHMPNSDISREWFVKYPLWLAWFSPTHINVKIPKNWTECLIWQDGTYTIDKEKMGVWSEEIDHNFFNGGKEKFEFYFDKIENSELPKNKIIANFSGTKAEYKER